MARPPADIWPRDTSNITGAIRKRTSDWIAHDELKSIPEKNGEEREHNINVLPYLPINQVGLEVKSQKCLTVQNGESGNSDCPAPGPVFYFETCEMHSAVTPDLPGNEIKRLQAMNERWQESVLTDLPRRVEHFIRDISRAIIVNVPERKHKHPLVRSSEFRQNLLHGAYPDSFPKGDKQPEETEAELETSKNNLLKLPPKHGKLRMMYMYSIISKADAFVEAVTLYLQRQENIQESGISELFVAFAAVAGLNFSLGQSITNRTMKVLGVDVRSETDLRAYAGYVTSQEESGRTLSEYKRDMKVIAIAQIKAAPPTSEGIQESLKPVAGRLLGELILEMPHTALQNTLVGFAVQSTKVRVSLLTLPSSALDYIQRPDHNPEEFKIIGGCYDCSYNGNLDWSESLDMLNPRDRIKLWTFMMKLVQKYQVSIS